MYVKEAKILAATTIRALLALLVIGTAGTANAEESERVIVHLKQAPAPDGFKFSWSMRQAERECLRRRLAVGRAEHTLRCIGPSIGTRLGLPAASEVMLTFCGGKVCSVAVIWMSDTLPQTLTGRVRASLELRYGQPVEDAWALENKGALYIATDTGGAETHIVTHSTRDYFAPEFRSSRTRGSDAAYEWLEPPGWRPKDVGGVRLDSDRAAVLNACDRAGVATRAETEKVTCEGSPRQVLGVAPADRMDFEFCNDGRVCRSVMFFWDVDAASRIRQALTEKYGPAIQSPDLLRWNSWGEWHLDVFQARDGDVTMLVLSSADYVK